MAPQVSDRPRRLVPIPSSLSNMILYLLFPALILGIVESQTANVTEETLSRVEGNQTFSGSTNDNSTVKARNVTSSLYKEDELQNNKTPTVITEDDENFQVQESFFENRFCDQDALLLYSHKFCGEEFHSRMQNVSSENWCDLEDIIRPYNDMTVCLEYISGAFGCYYPHPTTQDFFIQIHSQYFQNCSKEELLLDDAPYGLVVALTIIPVSLIPVLVYQVVWKSKVHQ